jgi:GMP synthase-like glutamine amidotransferase
MRVLGILHQEDAGLGVFARPIAERGAELDSWLLPDGGPPPDDPFAYQAVLTLGGSANPDERRRFGWIRREQELLSELLAAGTSIMGLCLGGQLLAVAAGGSVRRACRPEIGWYGLEPTAACDEDPVLGGVPAGLEVLEWHGYEFLAPPGAVPLARSEVCLQACRIGSCAWALQFHPEVDRRILDGWIDEHHADPDVATHGLDLEELRAESDPRIDAFNAFGGRLCARWLDAAAAEASTVSGSGGRR